MERHQARSHPNPLADLSDAPRLLEVIEDQGGTRYIYECPDPPPRVRVDHDEEKRLFRVTGPDGETAVFRDQPVRFLVVEPDPQTGELTPVTRSGEPKYLYVCREE